MTRPMSGLRVADFTTMIAGPYCTRLLADSGAEVIKVEAPGGDHMRFGEPLRNGASAYFGHLNCGKRSIVLDLKTQAGKAAARDLVAACDVVVENARPGVMKRLGLDYASLAADLPALVYCSISGFGQTGPRAAQPAYAPVVHALSGYDLTHLFYQDGLERPAKNGIFVADVLAAVYAFAGIQTALLGRERHGTGQYVDVALMDTMINLLVYECQEAQFPSATRRPLYTPMQASDGFVIIAPVNQRNFEQLADATGHPEWKRDPRFADVAARRENWDALMDAIEDWTRVRSAADCEDSLMGLGVPCARYRTVREAMQDPQVVARGLFAAASDSGGSFQVPNAPFQFADGSIAIGPQVPDVDADGEDILRALLGYGDAQVAALRGPGA